MNDDFQHLPPPPPDEAADPLLQALRQHLGAGFGQEPPARLWAGIRQQLPAAPKPWWRRPRRLLPLLLLLLLGTVGVWQLGWRRPGYNSGPGRYAATGSARLATPPPGAPVASGSAAATRGATGPAAARRPGAAASSAATAPAASYPVAPVSGNQPLMGTTTRSPQARAAVPAKAALLAASTGSGRPAAVASPLPARRATTVAEVSPAAIAGWDRRRRQEAAGPAATIAAGLPRQGAHWHGRAMPVAAGGAAVVVPRAQERAGLLATRAGRRRNARQLPAAEEAALPAGPTSTSRGQTGRQTGQSQLPAYPPATPFFAPDSLRADRAAALALLGLRLPALRPSLPGLPAPLAATELAPSPWLPPARRWAVQVLAGPTLSYRSIRLASGGGLAYATPNPTANIPTYSPGLPDTTSRVGLERAALGWGAQVQARRVLAGRWALAAGLGYHEYATYLSLDVTTRTYNSLSSSIVASTLAVRQRDTYRVLTLPMQLSYALAPPRGRLALGVLGGLEPSLYLGGRSTERSSCACEQQEFTSAANSPYNSLSLALSLGLDARYHLGGPTSGWTLLVQPTGRYVASPFVRNPGWGYALRQPYSLGLLTGVAWEW